MDADSGIERGSGLRTARYLLYCLAAMVPVIVWTGTHYYVSIKAFLAHAVAFVFLCLVLVSLVRGRRLALSRTPLDGLLILLLVIAGFSLLFSPFRDIGIYRLPDIFLCLFLFFWAAAVLTNEQSLGRLYSFWLISAAAVSLYGIAHWRFPNVFKLKSLMGNVNLEAGYLVLTLPLAVSMAARQYAEWRHKQTPALYASTIRLCATVIIVCAALTITGSRGAALGIAGSALCFVLCLWKTGKSVVSRKLLLACLALVVIMGLQAWIFFPVLTRNLEDMGGVGVRLHIWRSIPTLAAARPLLGWGWGTFMTAHSSYAPPGPWKEVAQHAHSEPLEILVETGIIGFSVFVIIFVLFFYRGAVLIRSTRNHRLRALISGLLAGVAGILAHNLVSVNLRFPSSFIPMWIAVGAVMGMAGGRFAVDGRKVNRLILGVFAVSIVLFTAHYGRLFVIDPFLAEHHVRQGDNYYRSADLGDKRLEEAEKQYSEAASMDPTFTWAYWRLARVHEIQGEYGQALAALQRMERILPGCTVLRDNIRFVRMKLAEENNGIEGGRHAALWEILPPYPLGQWKWRAGEESNP